MFLDRNFYFLGDYLVVIARYLVVMPVTARYLVVTSGYWSLLVVTGLYRSLLLFSIFSMNVAYVLFVNDLESGCF